ncbi:MAG: heavy metal translocating P-type ATPase, partial [Methanotrichaceae archaeon]|nr:heavy metal translocating P-type ATPase [Methanotrichaceae archaeon]
METKGSPETGEGHKMHKMAEGQSMEEHGKVGPEKGREKEQKPRHGRHEGHVTEDFKRRFIISTILTIPILILSPFIQGLLGFELVFPGSTLLLFLLSTLVYFYGGYPFLKG